MGFLGFFSEYHADVVPVSLARAMYSRASVLLLDDVLAAGKYSNSADSVGVASHFRRS